jgi:hypothetical protein
MVNDINHQTVKAGLGIQILSDGGLLAISWGDSGLKCCHNEIVYCQLFLVSFFSVLLPLHIQQVADYGLHTTIIREHNSTSFGEII